MLTASDLKRYIEGRDWVVVRPSGEPIEMEIPRDFGPATLIVGQVTDALKLVDEEGLIGGSLDRDSVWSVGAFALNRVIVARLEGDLSPCELYDSVREMGITWQWVHPPRDLQPS